MTGKLRQVTSKLDHEEYDTFIITVKVTDIAIQPRSFQKNFTMKIVNVIEPPADNLFSNKMVNLFSVLFAIDNINQSHFFRVYQILLNNNEKCLELIRKLDCDLSSE